jgi:uncharacterized protein (TIGR00369 family)
MKELLPGSTTCFFCGRATGGLALELHYIDGVASCEFTARETFQGYAGLLHGGIITGILDEVMFWTVFMEAKKICATWKIEVEFKRPVVCGSAYRASGHLQPATRNTDYLATGIIEDGSGKTCAIGSASFRMMRGITLEGLMEYLDFRGVSPEMQSLFQTMKT